MPFAVALFAWLILLAFTRVVIIITTAISKSLLIAVRTSRFKNRSGDYASVFVRAVGRRIYVFHLLEY